MISMWLILAALFSAVMGAVLPTAIVISILRKGQGRFQQMLKGGILYFFTNYIVISFFTAMIGYYIKLSKDNINSNIFKILIIVVVTCFLELLVKYLVYGLVANKNNDSVTMVSYAAGYSFASAMIMVGYSSLNILFAAINLKIGNTAIFSGLAAEGKTLQGLIAAYQNLEPKLYLLSGFQAVVTILYEMLSTYIWFRYFKDREKHNLTYLILLCVLYNSTLYAATNFGMLALLVALIVQSVILITLLKHLDIAIFTKWKNSRTFTPAKG